MGWFDRWFRGPTLEGVAEQVVQSLRRRGARDIQVNLAMSEVVAKVHGDSPVRIYLGNLLVEFQRTRRGERPGVVERFLDGIATPHAGIPANYEDAKPKLMPVVRNGWDLGITELTARRSPGETPYSGPAHRPLAADVVVALVCDLPTAMSYVTERQLQDWGTTFDDALEHALMNLRGLPEASGWSAMAQGVWLGDWGDAYDSSRLLLPDLIHRLNVPEPVALVPFRNALLVTSARNPAGLALIGQVVEQALADTPRWLSFEPLKLVDGRDGQQWQRHDLPPELQEQFRVLREHNREGTYTSQKHLLDDLHETENSDLFVASYQLMQRDAGPLRSMAVWTQGVDTLLPRTELIAFVIPGEAADPTLWFVAWADVQDIAAPLLEATHLLPERWRVRSFPDEATVARLREREVVV